MKGYYGEIEDLTIENKYFRKVLYTGKFSQLVLMSLKPGEDIGEEVHNHVDQFFRFEEGEGEVIIDKNTYKVKDGDAVVVPAGSKHNVINTSKKESLKLYTLYSPSNHPDKTVHKTRKQAMEEEHHH